MAVHVVWFKRDLRIADHEPLAQAAASGTVLPLYIVEPAYWRQPDAAGRQFAFVRESVLELRAGLGALGQPLIVETGDAVRILDAFRESHGIEALCSHQETGNGWTYARDRRVRSRCDAHGIPWHESMQFGVVRRLPDRAGRAGRCDRQMARAAISPRDALGHTLALAAGLVPQARDLGLDEDICAGSSATNA